MADLSRARKVPYHHQIVGVDFLVKWNDPDTGRIHGGCTGVFDEMGAGKTKQIIDAAQVLHGMGEIDTVLVIAPNTVRPVWFEPEFGELSKHLWLDYPVSVGEYRQRMRYWEKSTGDGLRWIITNYEFVRSKERLEDLIYLLRNQAVWLVLDESSCIANHRAKQTKACYKIRKNCKRITILNGTPISHSPNDLYSQMFMLDWRILGFKYHHEFRSVYAIMGGWQQKEIVGWRNLEELQTKIKPYVIRRLKKDCLDLPEKLEPITMTVALTSETWKTYKEVRDELITWLDAQTVSVVQQAAVKAMRLAQVTAGFLGGLKLEEDCECGLEADPLVIGACRKCGGSGIISADVPPREISSEKLDFITEWVIERLADDPNFKLVLWGRFRPQIRRLYEVFTTDERFRDVQVGLIWGGQTKESRAHTLSLLKPESAPTGPVIGLGTPSTGALGLDFAASHYMFFGSNDPSLRVRLQAEDRVHRPGQNFPCWYGDLVATGPNGQKTIDHHIIKALHDREDLATWTCSAWISALKEE